MVLYRHRDRNKYVYPLWCNFLRYLAISADGSTRLANKLNYSVFTKIKLSKLMIVILTAQNHLCTSAFAVVSVSNSCLISFALVSTDSINFEETFTLQCMKMSLTILSD
jgi:hypothetical protein